MSRFGLRRGERAALTVALAWAAALPIAALTVPVYSGTATLVDENGLWGLWVCCIPLTVAVVLAVLLGRRGDRRGAGVTAWVLFGLLALGNLAALLTIGFAVLPVTGALAVACGLRQSRWPVGSGTIG